MAGELCEGGRVRCEAFEVVSFCSIGGGGGGHGGHLLFYESESVSGIVGVRLGVKIGEGVKGDEGCRREGRHLDFRALFEAFKKERGKFNGLRVVQVYETSVKF